MENNILDTVNDYYERFMFGEQAVPIDKIGFFNVGYWNGVEDSLEVAQINLIETLVSFFTNTDGNVLDVACGKGASTKFLTKYFAPKNIIGIDISERQLEICRVIAPECDFKLMDATNLNFSDSSFDNVLCIESANHFLTRYKFLEEAHRILKPAGRLAIWDYFYDENLLGVIGPAHPKENYLPSLDAYREDMLKVGFKYVRIEDATEFSVKSFQRHQVKRMEREFEKKRDYKILEKIIQSQRHVDGTTVCLVYAIK